MYTQETAKAMAPQSSTPAWRIPWMEEPGGLPPMGSHRVGHDWNDLAAVAQHTQEKTCLQWQVCPLPTDHQASPKLATGVQFLSLSRTFWLQRSMCLHFLQFSSVQSLSHVRLFATPWIAAHLSNSMKPSHVCGATQSGRVMVERSDRMWSTGEGNGKPFP